jgi:hypothetical protein
MISHTDSKQVMKEINDVLKQSALLVEDVDKKRRHDKADNVIGVIRSWL